MANAKKTLFDAFYGDQKAPKTPPNAKPRPQGDKKAAEAAEAAETVPGPRGEPLDADKPVNLTFTVSARERYLWNIALKKHGLTGASVLREAMNLLIENDPPHAPPEHAPQKRD